MLKAFAFAALLLAAAPGSAQITEREAAAVIADPDRSDYDRGLDEKRMPAKALAFMQIERGDRVLDIFAGGGYFAEPIARLVGPEGFVVAQNPPSFAESEQLKQAMAFRRYGERLPNAASMHVHFRDMQLAPNSFDLVLFHLVYHDLYWQSDEYGLPRTEPHDVLAQIHRALRPGGTVTVIDHVGNKDDPRAEVDAVHRIDPDIVVRDFRQAGFELVARETFHENPEDEPSLSVFDEKVRGHTDRFALRFAKAGDPNVTPTQNGGDDPNVDVPVAGAGDCDAAAAQRFVGRRYDDALRAAAREASGAGAVRAYGSGDAITMDYREDRLNIEYDEGGTVVAITCG